MPNIEYYKATSYMSGTASRFAKQQFPDYTILYREEDGELDQEFKARAKAKIEAKQQESKK